MSLIGWLKFPPLPDLGVRQAVIVVAVWFWALGWTGFLLVDGSLLRTVICLGVGPIAWIAFFIGPRWGWRPAAL